MVCRLLLVVIGLLAGCGGDDSFELFVDLQTDVVPGVEFDLAHIELLDERGPLGETLRSADHGIVTAESYTTGVRVAELSQLDGGTYVVRIELRLGATPVANALAEVAVDSDRAITVIVTRSCIGVSCPMFGDDPGAASCLGGSCALPRCASGAAAGCPTQCSEASECSSLAGCGAASCLRSVCLYDGCGGKPIDGGSDDDGGAPVDAGSFDASGGDAAMPRLIAWYPMDTDPLLGVPDMSGNDHDGACDACPTMTAGVVGGAYSFDNDAIIVPHMPSLEAVDAITVTAWVRLGSTTLDDDRVIAAIPFGSGLDNSWQLFIDQDDGTTTFGIGMRRALAPSNTPTQWVHRAGTFDGQTIRVFENGVRVANAGFSSNIQYDGKDLLIGADANGGTVRGFFDGDLDEVRIYSGALSESQVGALATAP